MLVNSRGCSWIFPWPIPGQPQICRCSLRTGSWQRPISTAATVAPRARGQCSCGLWQQPFPRSHPLPSRWMAVPVNFSLETESFLFPLWWGCKRYGCTETDGWTHVVSGELPPWSKGGILCGMLQGRVRKWPWRREGKSCGSHRERCLSADVQGWRRKDISKARQNNPHTYWLLTRAIFFFYSLVPWLVRLLLR